MPAPVIGVWSWSDGAGVPFVPPQVWKPAENQTFRISSNASTIDEIDGETFIHGLPRGPTSKYE